MDIHSVACKKNKARILLKKMGLKRGGYHCKC